MVGALKDINPVWIGDGGKEVEAVSIKVSVREMDIRIVCAYDPQEYDDIDKKIIFWKFLDNEVFLAYQDGNGLIGDG